MAITDGIITGALHPANEGLTVRQALTREVMDIYARINDINNRFVSGSDSPYNRLSSSVAAIDQGEGYDLALYADALGLCALMLAEVSARYRSNSLIQTLSDCGVDAGLSNLSEVLERVFGPDAASALQNIQNAVSILMAMEAVFDRSALGSYLAQFTALGQVIGQVAPTTTNVAGV